MVCKGQSRCGTGKLVIAYLRYFGDLWRERQGVCVCDSDVFVGEFVAENDRTAARAFVLQT
jgi:hypothetical protein